MKVFPTGRFPTSAVDCKDCDITCKDCSVLFRFEAAQQCFYIEKIKFPNFPKSCDKCRKENKLRKEAAEAPTVLIAVSPALPDPVSAPANTTDAWDEGSQFADANAFAF